MTGAAGIGSIAAALVVASALLPSGSATGAPSLIADLSSEEIAITAGFSGAELLLFGAVEGEGDVVVVVRGPRRRELVRRKTRIAGIWVNGKTVACDDVPVFYRVASTAPLDGIASPDLLAKLGIGAGRLRFTVVGSEAASTVAEFRTAMLRNKRKSKLYGDNVGTVTTVGGRLVRTSVSFPANVQTGTYKVDVYLFRGGRVIGRFEKPLTVRKAGIEARIYNFAHQQSALYGALAIVMALMAGWLAGVVFRKV